MAHRQRFCCSISGLFMHSCSRRVGAGEGGAARHLVRDVRNALGLATISLTWGPCMCTRYVFTDSAEAIRDLFRITAPLPNKLKVALAISWLLSAIFVVPANALPPLNEIVVSRDVARLESELRKGVFSEDELGSALIAAAGVNNLSAIQQLLGAGAPINYQFIGQSPLQTAINEQNHQAVELLLEKGADPNIVGNFDWRPLHFAITKNAADPQIIRLLIEHGAEIDSRTSLLVTPLHRAAGFCKLAAVKMLLQMGADRNLTEKYGQTAEQRARKAGCADVADALR
jgi:ankyrin repeat protein